MLIGVLIFGSKVEVIAAPTAVVAGVILVMSTDAMVPGAFEQAHNFAGLITVFGFLAAFVLSEI